MTQSNPLYDQWLKDRAGLGANLPLPKKISKRKAKKLMKDFWSKEDRNLSPTDKEKLSEWFGAPLDVDTSKKPGIRQWLFDVILKNTKKNMRKQAEREKK